MSSESFKNGRRGPALKRQIEGREWWLWAFAVLVTLVLTAGIVLLTFSGDYAQTNIPVLYDLREWVRGLAALVLIFDIYTVYQHFQLQQLRRQLAERDELFQLITENAADMIAVVDSEGKRLYNSPAYQKVLGYTAEDLNSGSSIDQIHPSDRERIMQAAAKARTTGQGQRLEYRMRHKDGSWRILESTASPIQNVSGNFEKLVIVNRDITERKRAEEDLAHNTFHDKLTDLPNRALFLDRVQRSLVRSRRHSDFKFAVLFVDIDEFKVINDSLGHSAGDELLIQIALRLNLGFREGDTVSRTDQNAENGDPRLGDGDIARLGGDEFTILLEDVFQLSDAVRVAQRIQERLAIPFSIAGQEIVIGASIGVASSNVSYDRAEDLLRDAEIAMYRAKREGKARYEVFDPEMHSGAVRRLKLETDLRRALENGELIAYYQPIVSLESGKITGFEALSRWPHPSGMIPPDQFIPVADETGLILPLNRMLFLDACRQLRTWQNEFPCNPPLTMSVNVTSRQFSRSELPQEILEILKETGVAASALNLEIVETIAMSDPDRALSMLSALKQTGVKLSIDDFGTGYSSLSRLPRFPIDALKIDRAFVREMNADRESHEIVRLIIMLAHNLGLKIVAEGTETGNQVAELKQLGCEMAQGYLFSSPVPPESARELLLKDYQPALAARAAKR